MDHLAAFGVEGPFFLMDADAVVLAGEEVDEGTQRGRDLVEALVVAFLHEGPTHRREAAARALRFALIVRAMSTSEWLSERNAASYCDGGRKIPWATISLK